MVSLSLAPPSAPRPPMVKLPAPMHAACVPAGSGDESPHAVGTHGPHDVPTSCGRHICTRVASTHARVVPSCVHGSGIDAPSGSLPLSPFGGGKTLPSVLDASNVGPMPLSLPDGSSPSRKMALPHPSDVINA